MASPSTFACKRSSPWKPRRFHYPVEHTPRLGARWRATRPGRAGSPSSRTSASIIRASRCRPIPAGAARRRGSTHEASQARLLSHNQTKLCVLSCDQAQSPARASGRKRPGPRARRACKDQAPGARWRRPKPRLAKKASGGRGFQASPAPKRFVRWSPVMLHSWTGRLGKQRNRLAAKRCLASIDREAEDLKCSPQRTCVHEPKAWHC